METLRVAYRDNDGEPREAIVQAENADDAIAQLEDYDGHSASVTAVGPEAQELPDDGDVNEGDEHDRTLDEAREELDQPAPPPDPED